MSKLIELRGHHLLCILTYIGLGYTQEFTKNFDAVIDRINEGAKINIVSGPDGICAALQEGAVQACDHAQTCHQQSVKDRDSIALSVVASFLERSLVAPGDIITLDATEIINLRRAFVSGKIRKACAECSWFDTCTTIAAQGFSEVKLMPKAKV